MLPALRKRCEVLADMGVEVSSLAMAFSSTEEEVRWALRGYLDAYGPMMQESMCMFRRCACVDSHGNLKPCNPPAAGFACRKEATLVKKYIVLKRHRQEREWRQQKIDAIHEAEVVAETYARTYLSSKEGSLFIKQLAFEKAEIMLHEQTVEKLRASQDQVRGLVSRRTISSSGAQLHNRLLGPSSPPAEARGEECEGSSRTHGQAGNDAVEAGRHRAATS
jgi:hypothetical protein